MFRCERVSRRTPRGKRRQRGDFGPVPLYVGWSTSERAAERGMNPSADEFSAARAEMDAMRTLVKKER